jgi:copper chaperone CopZ
MTLSLRPLFLLSVPALAVAACGTPQERCVASVTRDLRVVDGLIDEAEVNLARGYGIRQTTVFVPVWEYCGPPVILPTVEGTVPVAVPAGLCLDERAQTVSRPVAIDLEAERRKLAQLQDQRARLSRQAAPAIAECRALYPR